MHGFEKAIAVDVPVDNGNKAVVSIFPSGSCRENILHGHAICCDFCDKWFHGNCVGMNRGQVKEKEREAWTCGCNDEPQKSEGLGEVRR